MSKTLIIRDEAYEYPDTGEVNYGEEATGWAGDVTSVLAEVSGPGDIPTTEVQLIGTDTGTHIEGNVNRLVFDTAYVQKINVTGFIRRTFTDATPDLVEEFELKGSYNGSVFNITIEFSGDDTEVEFDTSGGQVTFKYLKNVVIDEVVKETTDQVRVKFSAKAIVDEAYFS